VKQSDKIIHSKFLTLDCNCQSFESKHEHAVAMIYLQRHCSQENGDTYAKAKGVLRFNETKFVKRGQLGSRMEFGLDPSSQTSMYAFRDSFIRRAVCVNGKFPLLQNVWMELEYQLYACRVTNSAHKSGTSKWPNKL
jgi:hypothetical protein